MKSQLTDALAARALDALPKNVAILGADGRIVAVNAAWRRFAADHVANPEVVGEGADYLAVCDRAAAEGEEDAAAFGRGIRDVLAGRIEEFHLEYPCHSPGDRRWFMGRVTRFETNEGPHAVAVHADVTARVRAEQEVAGQHRRFRGLVEGSLDVTAILNPDATVAYVSPSVEAVLGYVPDELVGRDPFELVHPDDLESVSETFSEGVTEPGATRRVEYRYRHADGSWRHVESVARNLLDDPAIAGVVVNTRDVTEHKEAERRATENEARYRTLVEQVPAITYVWEAAPATPRAVPTYTSPQIEAILGFTADEWEVDPDFWATRVHPDDRDRVLAESRRCERTGDPFRMEYRYLAKDDSVVWVHDEAVLLSRRPDGRPHLFQGVTLDVTAQKGAEERLREQERRYRTLVEQLPGAVVYAWEAPSGERSPLSYLSPQIERLLGYSAEEWMAHTGDWPPFAHPDDRARVHAEVERSEREGTPFELEYRFVAKGGRVVWVQDRAEAVGWSPEGRPVAFQGVMIDVTARKEAEQRLRLLESAVESQAAAVMVLDAPEPPEEGRIVYVNPGFTELTGYESEEAVGSMVRLLRSPNTDSEISEGFYRALVERRSFRGENVIRRKDGSDVLVEWQTNPIRDGEGRITHWVSVGRDITELREAEAELRRGVGRLRQADTERRAVLEQLVGFRENEWVRIAEGIEDDSIQAMTALGLRLDALRRSLDDPEQLGALDKLGDVVEQTMGRLRHLLVELRPRALDTDGLAAAIREYLDVAAGRGGFAFRIEDDLDEEPPVRVRGVAYRVAQEAISHVADSAAASDVDVRLRSEWGCLVVEIRDDGVGFDVEHLESAPLERRLGLAGMRERARLAGGEVNISSRPGEGTTLEVRLPTGEGDPPS